MAVGPGRPVGGGAQATAPTHPHDDRALRLAVDFLGDQPARNVSLDELARAAGIGKFRLVRLFRERTGLPPHAFRIAQRVRADTELVADGERAQHRVTQQPRADASPSDGRVDRETRREDGGDRVARLPVATRLVARLWVTEAAAIAWYPTTRSCRSSRMT